MADKPEVLIIAGRYRPGYKAGGPVASVENLVQALGQEFDFRVLALDHDLGETDAYLEQARLPEATYVSSAEAADAVKQYVREARGIVYTQSLFSPTWGIMPVVWARPRSLLVAPRGQLAPGAMAQGSFKKEFVLRTLRPFTKRKEAYWQATAESDVADMRAAAPWLDPERILLAPNLPSDPGFVLRRKPAGRLKAVYVGRIDPKKNLRTAVRAVLAAGEGVTLDIVGPPEDGEYLADCLSLAIPQGAVERIRLVGPLPPGEVREKLCAADAFLFPTYGENYGHSIVEAMLSGLPALIGNTTPWRNLEKAKAGFDLPPGDVDGFAAALKKLAEMPEVEYVRWSEGARATIEAATEREAAVEASRRMLLKVYENSWG